MGRTKGALFTSSLDVNKRFPLDARMLVKYREDLINPDEWIVRTLTTDSTYNGMIVAVNSDGANNGVYVLIDRTLITQENYSNYKAAKDADENVEPYFAMWRRLANLDQLDELSARIKALEETGTGGGGGTGDVTKEELEDAIADAKEIRVNNIAELPNVGSKDTFYKCSADGYTYIWNGTNYEKFALYEVRMIDGGNASTLF